MGTSYNVRQGVVRVKTKARQLVNRFSVVAAVSVAALGVALMPAASAVAAPSYHTFGDASIVANGHPGNGAQLGNGGAGYGGVDFTDTGVMTLSDLNNLSTDCNFTQGMYGAGTPRFGADVQNADGSDIGNIFFYLNNTSCPQNNWGNTGNLASPTSMVDENALSNGTTETYAQAQAKYGTYSVTDLYIVSDTSFSAQTLLIDNTTVNAYTYTYGQPTPVAPTNKDQCKDGGYKNFQTSFKNQGACVSYVASNGKSQH